MLSAINSSKSAFGIIKLHGKTFFTSYNCPDPTNHRGVIVRCKMQIRVLCRPSVSDISFFSVYSRRAILRPERIRILVRNHVKSKSSIIHKMESADSSSNYFANMVAIICIELMNRCGQNASTDLLTCAKFLRCVQSRRMYPAFRYSESSGEGVFRSFSVEDRRNRYLRGRRETNIQRIHRGIRRG
jgi:hypothetical protein